MLPICIGTNCTVAIDKIKQTRDEMNMQRFNIAKSHHSNQQMRRKSHQLNPPAANTILYGCKTIAAAADTTEAPAIVPANNSIGVFPAIGLSGCPSADVVFLLLLPEADAAELSSEAEEAVLLASSDSSSYPPILFLFFVDVAIGAALEVGYARHH